ncbi:MAG: tRNA-modifying protein YgfZ [Acidimicrobiaceae bacterium]|nr:tRNA-modifying protein YgfZ [Acidimicrobiaceae bacterium]
MTDVEDYEAFREGVGWIELDRDVVEVSGPDALNFLQGQLSQDVEAMAPDTSAWSFLLQPQGRVDAFLRVTRLPGDVFLLDVDGDFGEAVLARLNRFKLRTKADLTLLDTWRCVALRGPGAWQAAPSAQGLVAAADWPGLPGVDLLGPAAHPPEGVRLCAMAAYQAVRIEAGVPEMGREVDDRTIPAETGLVERAASMTKGCYTGQELVARMDARVAAPPRQLRGLLIEGDDIPAPGEIVTSAAMSPRLGVVALGYVGRSAAAAETIEVDGRAARIRPLPLVE